MLNLTQKRVPWVRRSQIYILEQKNFQPLLIPFNKGNLPQNRIFFEFTYATLRQASLTFVFQETLLYFKHLMNMISCIVCRFFCDSNIFKVFYRLLIKTLTNLSQSQLNPFGSFSTTYKLYLHLIKYSIMPKAHELEYNYS